MGGVRRGICISGAQADVQVGLGSGAGEAPQWRSPREWGAGWALGPESSRGGHETDAVGCGPLTGVTGVEFLCVTLKH